MFRTEVKPSDLPKNKESLFELEVFQFFSVIENISSPKERNFVTNEESGNNGKKMERKFLNDKNIFAY